MESSILPIGHEAAREFLRKSIVQDKVAHAYCFVGPPSVGKTALAEWFMGELVGRGSDGTGEDFSAFRTNPDVVVVRRVSTDDEKKDTISVDEIRSLRQKLSRSSFLNSWKIAVIVQAETMTIGAANALLKTLEEPAPRTVIILLTSAWEMIPQTIRSRCQTVHLRPVPRVVLERALAASGVGREAVRTAVRLSAGRPGVARRLASDHALLRDRLGAYAACALVLGAPLVDRLQTAEALAKEKKDASVSEFISECRVLLHDLALPPGAREEGSILPLDFAPLTSLRSRILPVRARDLLVALDESASAIRQNVSTRVALEHFLLEF